MDLDAIKARLLATDFARLWRTVAEDDFIRHAPTDIAALLAEVERLRALPRLTPELAAALQRLDEYEQAEAGSSNYVGYTDYYDAGADVLDAYRAAREAT